MLSYLWNVIVSGFADLGYVFSFIESDCVRVCLLELWILIYKIGLCQVLLIILMFSYL